jgi:amino acid transporter
VDGGDDGVWLHIPASNRKRHRQLTAANSYALQWVVVLPLEIIAGALTVGYWNAEIPKSIFITFFLVVIVLINLTGIKGYGEAEFVFAIIKVTAVVGFILLGIVINIGGTPTGGYIGGTYWRDPGAFNNGFKGLCTVFVTAAFAFAGTELVGLVSSTSRLHCLGNHAATPIPEHPQDQSPRHV